MLHSQSAVGQNGHAGGPSVRAAISLRYGAAGGHRMQKTYSNPLVSLTSGTLLTNFYEKLVPEQVRVLEIIPGPSADRVTCFILRATLVAAEGIRLDEEWHDIRVVPFTAVSYVWGKDPRTSSILCNNREILVTPRLESALKRVRSKDQIRYVWNDKLCINQDENEEKGRQVQMMFSLFRKAQSVFCYLGDVQPEHERLLKILELFKNQKEESPDINIAAMEFNQLETQVNGWDMNWPSRGRRKSLEPPDLIATCKHIMQEYHLLATIAVDFVINCDWFRRTWIRQEIFAARVLEVACGHYRFDLEDLDALVRSCKSDSLQLIPFETVMSSLHLKQRQQSFEFEISTTTPFIDLALTNATGFGASDDLDRIYALQNIAEPAHLQAVGFMPKIDYSKSELTVYAEFTKRIMHRNGRLQMLAIVERRSAPNTGVWPSWLIDFRKNIPRVLLYPDIGTSRRDRQYDRLLDELRPSEIPTLNLTGIPIGFVGARTTYEDINWNGFRNTYSSLGCSDVSCLQHPHVYGARGAFNENMLMSHMHYECAAFWRSDGVQGWLRSETLGHWFPMRPREKIVMSEVVQDGDLVVMFDEEVSFDAFPHRSQCEARRPRTDVITESGNVFFVVRPLTSNPPTYAFLGPAFIVSETYQKIKMRTATSSRAGTPDILGASMEYVRSVTWAEPKVRRGMTRQEFILV